MKKAVLFALVVAGASCASAVGVSKVPEGKVCALSFTYDDGPATHYTHAFPLHKKYGFPGTFLIITSRVEDDKDPNRPHKNVQLKQDKATGEMKLVYIGKGEPKNNEIWLRVAPGETVTLNGKAVKPNAYGGVLAHIGDVVVSK